LLLILADNDTVAQNSSTAELPSATRCAAVFAITTDELKRKSGDPAMIAGFADDAAALRRIVVSQRRGDEAAADTAISDERKAMGESAASVDLKLCYRVKALGPTH